MEATVGVLNAAGRSLGSALASSYKATVGADTSGDIDFAAHGGRSSPDPAVPSRASATVRITHIGFGAGPNADAAVHGVGPPPADLTPEPWRAAGSQPMSGSSPHSAAPTECARANGQPP